VTMTAEALPAGVGGPFTEEFGDVLEVAIPSNSTQFGRGL